MIQSIQALGLSIGKLLLFLILGFMIFRIDFFKKRVFPLFFKIQLNLLFPLYFIHNFPSGWNKALGSGWFWMPIFFLACVIMMVFQLALGRFIIEKKKWIKTEHPQSLTLLFSSHNAGYIPLPILASVLDSSFMVFMFFYVMAFNIIFWTYTVNNFKGKSREKTGSILTPPLVGILIGIIISLLNMAFPFYAQLPLLYTSFMDQLSSITLTLILVLLGGILASIPVKHLSIRKEYIQVGIVKLIAYPLFFLAMLFILPLESLPPVMRLGIPLALIIEAATPPATNIMIIAKAFGSEGDLSYLGSGIIFTYAMSFITLPIFLIITLIIFQ
ncbi:MAG: AEC family transporter [Spirochaetales bacterium]|nr:AEC family transporter [Spirochaetales bacterium]